MALLMLLFGCSHMKLSDTKQFTITGTLSDYNGNPLEHGEVILKGSGFKDLEKVHSNEKGNFVLTAPKGEYVALYAVKDYKTRFLEFWYWDLSLTRDYHLDIKIDGLEIYGMKAWRSYSGAIIFFRPMSLQRYKQLGDHPKDKPALIAPNLRHQDVKVTIDGQQTKIWELTKVKERIDSSAMYMDAYLMHVDDLRSDMKRPVQTICVDLVDNEIGERGMGCAPLK